jgi:hypothetical protein
MITKEEIRQSVVRALTWKEPFATAMLRGKSKETRTWKVYPRGLVLICSGMAMYSTDQLIEICGIGNFDRLCTIVGDRQRIFSLTRGKAIAIGRLVECWPMKQEDEAEAFVKLNRLYVHKYVEIRPINPFPFRGKQGWTILTEEQKNQIEFLNP